MSRSVLCHCSVQAAFIMPIFSLRRIEVSDMKTKLIALQNILQSLGRLESLLKMNKPKRKLLENLLKQFITRGSRVQKHCLHSLC